MPFRPNRSDTADNIDLSGLKLDGSPRTLVNGNLVAALEAKVNGHGTIGA